MFRSIVACFAAAGLVAIAGAQAASAQEPATYSPPRSADGRPDFQGVWAARWLTTLERPSAISALVVTPEDGVRIVADMLARRGGPGELDPEIAEPDNDGLARVRGEVRTSMIVEPADGRLPLTSAGVERMKSRRPPGFDHPEERMTNERCIVGGGRAPFLIAPAGQLRQIVQTSDHIVMLTEAFGDLRIVPIGRETASAGPSRFGHSLAHWEGDTLVVVTTGFRADDLMRAVPYSAVPLDRDARVIERFIRVAPDEILYQFTVDAPDLYARPWLAEYSFVRSNQTMFEFACHEGNYGLSNILSGARETERRGGAVAVIPPR